MAKTKGGINRSQAIRDILKINPHAKSKEIIAELAGKGIEVSQNLVYLIRSKAKQKKRRQKRDAAVAISSKSGIADPIKLVLSVKQLARDAGGLKYLKQLVDVLAE